MPEIQSFREVVETSVMDKSFGNVHVAAIHQEMADLSYLAISIDGIAQPVKGLHDSGAQISVIRPDLIKDILPHLPREGTVKLKGLIGDPIDADLISLSVKLFASNDNGTFVIMAMSDKVNNGLILTDPVVQSLIKLSHQCDDTDSKTQPEVFSDLVADTSASES